MRNLPITEVQTAVFPPKAWPSNYRYLGRREGLHAFQDGEKIELFAKRKSATSGWQLWRGNYYYEFCRSL